MSSLKYGKFREKRNSITSKLNSNEMCTKHWKRLRKLAILLNWELKMLPRDYSRWPLWLLQHYQRLKSLCFLPSESSNEVRPIEAIFFNNQFNLVNNYRIKYILRFVILHNFVQLKNSFKIESMKTISSFMYIYITAYKYIILCHVILVTNYNRSPELTF